MGKHHSGSTSARINFGTENVAVSDFWRERLTFSTDDEFLADVQAVRT